jgi:hypothetical protein
MNRRNFLSLLSSGLAGIALDQAIPLGRVWSFPKEIVLAKTSGNLFLPMEWVTKDSLQALYPKACYVREMWRVSGDVVERRSEVLHPDGIYEPLSDWEPTGLKRPPLTFVATKIESSQPFRIVGFATNLDDENTDALSQIGIARKLSASPHPFSPTPTRPVILHSRNGVLLRS